MSSKVIVALITAVLVVIAAFWLSYSTQQPQENEDTFTTNSMESTMHNEQTVPEVRPIEHASVVLNWGEHVLYVDPVGDPSLYANEKEPGIIFLTDIHGDHLSTTTLEALATDQTQLIVPQAVADQLPPSLLEKSLVLANGETTSQRGFSIEAMPMYNIPESEEAYHTKGRGNGYIIEREGVRVYIAGDTGPTPEMQLVQDIDIAFVPMNLPYTMSVEEAAQAVGAFAPKRVYPYHYRGPDGLSDVAHFKELVEKEDPNIEVVLLEWYPQRGA